MASLVIPGPRRSGRVAKEPIRFGRDEFIEPPRPTKAPRGRKPKQPPPPPPQKKSRAAGRAAAIKKRTLAATTTTKASSAALAGQAARKARKKNVRSKQKAKPPPPPPSPSPSPSSSLPPPSPPPPPPSHSSSTPEYDNTPLGQALASAARAKADADASEARARVAEKRADALEALASSMDRAGGQEGGEVETGGEGREAEIGEEMDEDETGGDDSADADADTSRAHTQLLADQAQAAALADAIDDTASPFGALGQSGIDIVDLFALPEAWDAVQGAHGELLALLPAPMRPDDGETHAAWLRRLRGVQPFGAQARAYHQSLQYGREEEDVRARAEVAREERAQGMFDEMEMENARRRFDEEMVVDEE